MNTYKNGYENLLVYKIGVIIYDLTVLFCKSYIRLNTRTYDQMIQAARSGKQNIVEGSLENSIEGNLKLTGIARASYGELLEDYKDYLRQNNLTIWEKEDKRVMFIRRVQDNSYKSYKPYKTYMFYINSSENHANLLITLCYKQLYLLQHILHAIENKFIKEGGFRENLFNKRNQFRKTYKTYKSY